MAENGKIRILHMTPPIVTNGVYKYIFNLWKYIDHNKFQFEFLMQNPEGLMQTSEWKKYKFPIRSFSTVQRDNPQRFRNEIYSILSDGYEILELHTSFWRGFMIEEIAMEVGVSKVIVHSHSSGLDKNTYDERKELIEKHAKYRSEFTLDYATDFWACSKMAAKWLFGPQIPCERIKIIENGIAAKDFTYDVVQRKRVRKKLNIEDAFVIGNVGRFEYQKNHAFLLDVFKKVNNIIPNSILLLVGDGELRCELEEYAKELNIENSAILVGWDDDIAPYYNAMDCFVFPSKFEGFGLARIEAVANGLPCVLSEQLPRAGELDGKCTYLPLEKDTWVNSITKLNGNAHDCNRQENVVLGSKYDFQETIRSIERMYLA